MWKPNQHQLDFKGTQSDVSLTRLYPKIRETRTGVMNRYSAEQRQMSTRLDSSSWHMPAGIKHGTWNMDVTSMHTRDVGTSCHSANSCIEPKKTAR